MLRAITALAAMTALSVVSAIAAVHVLPRNVVLPLSTVQQYFPQVTREHYSGSNTTAAGNPIATRSVIFVSIDASRKVTLTVDRYATDHDAAAAYRAAVAKSKVPGFSPISVPVFAEATFAGRVTRGAETDVGIGALAGKLIVGATLAGYTATDSTIAQLTALTRLETSTAKHVLL
jgi:hypothetical protein